MATASHDRAASREEGLWMEQLMLFQNQSRILQTWTIEGFLGKGTFARVFRARNRLTGQSGAIKFIPNPLSLGDCAPAGSQDNKFHQMRYESSKREAEIMMRFRGVPSVVQFLEPPEYLLRRFQAEDGVFVEQYAVLICMPLYHNSDLWQPLVAQDRARRLQLGIEMAGVLSVFEQKSVFHRDIKPGNILLGDDGHFYLSDVGEAKLESDSTTIGFHGTRPYMAPEVYNLERMHKKTKSDHRSDIYSLGIVLYRLFNHQNFPFLDENGTLTENATTAFARIEARDQIDSQYMIDSERARYLRYEGEPIPPPCEADEQLAQVILRACAYDREERYQQADDLRRALLCCRDGHPLPAALGWPPEADDEATQPPSEYVAPSAQPRPAVHRRAARSASSVPPASVRPASGQPASVQPSARPASGQPASVRPASGQPASVRPAYHEEPKDKWKSSAEASHASARPTPPPAQPSHQSVPPAAPNRPAARASLEKDWHMAPAQERQFKNVPPKKTAPAKKQPVKKPKKKMGCGCLIPALLIAAGVAFSLGVTPEQIGDTLGDLRTAFATAAPAAQTTAAATPKAQPQATRVPLAQMTIAPRATATPKAQEKATPTPKAKATAAPTVKAPDFTYSAVSGGLRIDGYKGTNALVTVPGSIDGQRVVAIGKQAFKDNAKLISVSLPEGVTSIGTEAFSGCSRLASVTLPQTLTAIQADAFNKCTSLTSINLPDSLTAIGDRAFIQCSNLSRLSIPASVTQIGYSAFRLCSNLTIVAEAGSRAAEYARENSISLLTDGQSGAKASASNASQALDITSMTLQADGTVRVQWTDRANGGPYDLLYRHKVSENYEDDWQQQQTYWRHITDTAEHEAVVTSFVPGEDYWVTIQSADGRTVVTDYHASPVRAFTDFKTRTELSPLLVDGETNTPINYIDADGLSSGRSYALSLRLYFSSLASNRTYRVTVGITDPNGVPVCSSTIAEETLQKGWVNWGWNAHSLDWTFERLKNMYDGELPSGAYKAQVFLDGNLAGEGSFSVLDSNAAMVKIRDSGSVNVREKSSQDSARVGSADAGAMYPCLGVAENGWYKIRLADGTVGYVSNNLATLIEN